MEGTDPHPVGTLCTEAETLQAEADAGLAVALLVGLLFAFLCVVDVCDSDDEVDDVGENVDEENGNK